MSSHDDPAPRSPASASLARVVLETEKHVAGRGWDAPVGIFALVRTAAAVEAEPDLARLLDEQALAEARLDPSALTVIEQDGLPAASDLEGLLAQLAWPPSVDGAAVSVERFMLPPSAEEEAAAITDATERMNFLQYHPQRSEVRIVVGVLRSGQTWCAVRSRDHDRDESVMQGPELVPGLIEALHSTLS